MVKIVYGHHRDINDIYFQGGWQGILYLDTVPKGSDVKYISEVEEKNGKEIIKSKISQEIHTLRFIASETMVRVLQKLPLLSNVLVTVDDFDEDKVYNLTFEVSEWLSGGAYAKCVMTFAINTYINKNAEI